MRSQRQERAVAGENVEGAEEQEAEERKEEEPQLV